MSNNPVLWQPDTDRVRATAMFDFQSAAGCDGYGELHRWSVEESPAFWKALCDYCHVTFLAEPSDVLVQPGDMLTARWFPGARLNYAQHLLRHGGPGPALIFRGENGERRELGFEALRDEVAAAAAGLRAAGVVKGDRVAGYLPNCPETIIAMLACASIGAIWTSCSPDFGSRAVIDRFGQTRPKVMFCADGYFYNGKTFDSLPAVRQVLAAVDSVQATVVVPFIGREAAEAHVPGGRAWADFCLPSQTLEFEPMAFDDPLFIMYSSGTTGVPKCIVHGTGGSLLQHLKEHVLHSDVRPGDRLFYFTTCGWMMWNWLASGLASGATLVLFDGAPFRNDGRILWEIAEQERLSIFGTSAKYLSALHKTGLEPGNDFDLTPLRCVLSTGSPLAPESYDYVYDAIASDLQLSSISGGTDILGCFALGNPILPVRRGELQCLGLGMAVDVVDDDRRPLVDEVGELVCVKPFPSMPVGFWNDDGDAKYRASYFERFPGIWAHGDRALLTRNGGMVIVGRSDSTLNPGGVRIGTAEIYRQVEKMPEVLDSVAIAQQWEDDVRIVLFVVLRDGAQLDEALAARIRGEIRSNTTPRHVPAKILAVPDIPRTISGKTVEIAVRNVVHGEAVKNADALANPEALEHFRGLTELTEP